VNPYGECPSVVSSSKGTAVGSMPCAVNPKSARAPDVDIFFFASLWRFSASLGAVARRTSE
jgi:hypothetical protein